MGNLLEPETQKPLEGYLIDDSTKNVHPTPKLEDPRYRGSGKLAGKTALVTGGDSGIGAAAAIAFAKEGADVAIVYYESDDDAKAITKRIEELGRQALSVRGDVGDEHFAGNVVDQVVGQFGKLDILVNNAAEQHVVKSIGDITSAQLDRTFRSNIFSMFYFVQAALPHMTEGASIINTTSVTAYKGSADLLDYAATKGAIVAFTRSLAANQEILDKMIRVNGVAPGPIWTPLIPATMDGERAAGHGDNVLMKRSGQPCELAPAYVYLASEVDSSYVTGQILHVNGGTIVNG